MGKRLASIAKGVATCSSTSAAYGQCVARSYKDAHKDMCAKEFDAFKKCVQEAIKRKW
ncbi:hypothetical protein DM01DRAFT_1332063 [Hesseltinella vesiculosa]|uniref:CHCH domain-containing protein n=1 Tax=Hesseltinella vesiculosa TaxID=101127 RepID=A0A1X2GU06_9FUNG|nr:hypothetical protein DM01DRAFT_1332063 [Hesseltinella vesiculosa]